MHRRRVSKGNRPDLIVHISLFMDTDVIPITYELFHGNAPDKATLITMLGRI